MENREIKLDDDVVHPEIYHGKEIFTVMGIRKNEVELEGDWSGMNNMIQRCWFKKDGIIVIDDFHI